MSHPPRETVILLHGLCRSPRSLRTMAKALEAAHYTVRNIGYPSRAHSIEHLSEHALAPVLDECHGNGTDSRHIHLVTHSLGGILVRQYARRHPNTLAGKVVMLGPPNQGSEVVDHLRHWKIFQKFCGPAGQQLGTDAASIPNTLGAVNFHCGIIAGTRTLNWINSLLYIHGPNDGKVSVERTKVNGMHAHLILPTTHALMMNNRTVIAQTITFLKTGQFSPQGKISAL